jgi:hypothetical protein
MKNEKEVTLTKNRIVLRTVPVCVAFVLGLIFGIWADWLTHRSHVFFYQVEPYNQANLVVRSGDEVFLEAPHGPNNKLRMNFRGGDGPGCADAQPSCLIHGTDAGGEYLFSCDTSDTSGLQCPDPGWYTPPTNPPPNGNEKLLFLTDVLYDFKHLFGGSSKEWEIQQYREQVLQPGTGPTGAVAASAYVDCNQSIPKTVEVWSPPSSGTANQPITISTGQTIVWRAHNKLTLNNLPDNFCTGGLQFDGSNNTTSCAVGVNPGTTTTYNYTATLASCTNDSPKVKIVVN